MYEAFFRFQSRPFPAAPVVANYFPAHSMESARQNLVRVVERAEGPGLVIGPAGVGKTLLLHVLADYFSQSFRVVMLSGTRVTTRKSLLQTILFELEIPYRGMDEGELRLALIDALRRNESIPHGILLLIDEAQTLSLRLLDETRLITNVAQDGQPRVRLVLAGNPRLEERFTNPKLESFNQRIGARCYLQAFSREETHEFVRAEVSWAGGNPDTLFSEETIRAIFQATDGIPRLINQVCEHALVLAHSAGHSHLGAVRIQEAWADMQQLPPPWQPTPTARPVVQSTVIEFGELAEEEEIAPASPAAFNEEPQAVEEEFVTPEPVTPELDPIVAQNDSPYEEPENLLEKLLEKLASESLVVSAPFVDDCLEWVNCAEQSVLEEVELQRHVEADPFADAFEEDVVVIDRFAARNLEGLRGRPRVSCPESRELAASLSLIQDFDKSPELQSIHNDSACLVTDSFSSQSFEFSTLQDQPVIDSEPEFVDELGVLGPGIDEQVELDFDEEIDCVPLPWTRGALGDDRDIIIVEEDSPKALGVGSEAPVDGARRTEFRELFAQLRRVST